MDESKDEGSSSSPSGITRQSLPRANSLPGEVKLAECSTASTSTLTLNRSKTERRKQDVWRRDPATQLFDDKISAKKKLRMLKRIATVRDDGSVLVDVPSNVEPPSHDPDPKDVNYETVDGEFTIPCDNQYMPPLQIVILIVGTQGDVQPFAAIGKRLQIWLRIKDFYLLHHLRFQFKESKSGKLFSHCLQLA